MMGHKADPVFPRYMFTPLTKGSVLDFRKRILTMDGVECESTATSVDRMAGGSWGFT